mgnify:FL=1
MTERDFIDIIKFAVFGILLHILCRLDCLPAITDYKERMVKLKSTGIVRKVDELGRIVLPIELRRTLDIAEKDSLEIYMDGPSIVLRKYQPACIFCDDAKDVIMFHGKNICPKCIKALQESLTQE